MKLSKALKTVLYLYFTVRILLSVIGYFVQATYPETKSMAAGGYEKPVHSHLVENLAGLWERADSMWFFHIARDGYQGNSDAAFFPLYPLLVRGVQTFTFLPWIFCGLIVSNLALVAAFYLLYKLVKLDFPEEIAESSVTYLALFPGAVFLFGAYTESLYLALTLGSFYFARKRQWHWVGLTSSALCMTRNTGILILIPLAMEWVKQALEGKRPSLKSSLSMLLVPITLIGYLYFWFWKTGDALAFIHKQDGWGRVPMFPLSTLWEGVKQALIYGHRPPGGIYVLDAVLVLVIIALALVGLKKIRASYSVFLFLSILPPLCAPFPGRMLMSFVRFLSVLWPAFLTLAVCNRNARFEMALFLVLAALLSFATFLFIGNMNMF